MGTSIEVHTEVKIGGEWHHYGCPFIERDYALFAKMANKRNEDGQVADPLTPHEGLPGDATKLTGIAAGLANYPVLWLDHHQISALAKWHESTTPSNAWGLEGQFDFVFSNRWAGIPNKLIEDARFIFWFD
jgi:hypothetical protein